MFIDRYGYGPDSVYTLNIYYLADAPDGEPQPQDDVAELRWFTADELPKDFAFPHSRLALDRWRAEPRAELTSLPPIYLLRRSPPRIGGIADYTARLAESIQELGLEVVVLVGNDHPVASATSVRVEQLESGVARLGTPVGGDTAHRTETLRPAHRVPDGRIWHASRRQCAPELAAVASTGGAHRRDVPRRPRAVPVSERPARSARL